MLERKGESYLLISYNTEIIRDICWQKSVAIQYLGKEEAIFLHARHSDIQAARTIYDLPVGKVTVEGNQCTLSGPGRLSIVMAPNYPVLSDRSLYDWTTVVRIKIMGINDVS